MERIISSFSAMTLSVFVSCYIVKSSSENIKVAGVLKGVKSVDAQNSEKDYLKKLDRLLLVRPS